MRNILDHALPENCAEYIRNAVQQKNYPDNATWSAAVIDRLENVFVPTMISVRVAKKDPQLSPRHIEEVFNEDRLIKELQIEERIDAMIDKSVKRLIQAKALKEIFYFGKLAVTCFDGIGQRLRDTHGETVAPFVKIQRSYWLLHHVDTMRPSRREHMAEPVVAGKWVRFANANDLIDRPHHDTACFAKQTQSPEPTACRARADRCVDPAARTGDLVPLAMNC